MILDEPVSAVDVFVQAEVLGLIMDLQRRLEISYVFVSHNRAVTEAVSDRIAVMYFGRIVEFAPARGLFPNPRHPYSRLLRQSVPSLRRRATRATVESGELPDPFNPPPGCAFAARCPNVQPRCRREAPDLAEIIEKHDVACRHPDP